MDLRLQARPAASRHRGSTMRLIMIKRPRAAPVRATTGRRSKSSSAGASRQAPQPPAITPEQRATHERWLKEITALPTAAGREQRVIAWVREWTAQRADLRLKADPAGNLLITRARKAAGAASKPAPLLITAHLDHPAFVVRQVPAPHLVELEFRGGVHDPYFEQARIEIFDASGGRHPAVIRRIDSAAKPFKHVAALLEKATDRLAPGDVGRWVFADERGGHDALPRIEDGLLRTHACDDLAAVAAALSALEALRQSRAASHVGVLLTRAEEVGFIGAIAACKGKAIARPTRLICLENSRSFPHDSPIGAGPIVRVGDKLSVFEPTLTNRISMLMMEHQKIRPQFKYQRKLMPGGTCEATTFSTYGYQSTCLCLPLGNYHNMVDIDAVTSGQSRRARVGPEYIALDDYHGLIEMLLVCAVQLDADGAPTLRGRMESLIADYGFVLKD